MACCSVAQLAIHDPVDPKFAWALGMCRVLAVHAPLQLLLCFRSLGEFPLLKRARWRPCALFTLYRATCQPSPPVNTGPDVRHPSISSQGTSPDLMSSQSPQVSQPPRPSHLQKVKIGA